MANNKNKEIVDEFEELRQVAAIVTHKLNMGKLNTYSAYLQGARAAMLAFCDEFPQIFRGKEAVYNRAVVELATSSLRNTDLFLSKEYQIHFRNHVSNKKGKCVKCEAYFAKQVTTNMEVK